MLYAFLIYAVSTGEGLTIGLMHVVQMHEIPYNLVESRRPGWVLNVQDPIVFTAISTSEMGHEGISYEHLFPAEI